MEILKWIKPYQIKNAQLCIAHRQLLREEPKFSRERANDKWDNNFIEWLIQSFDMSIMLPSERFTYYDLLHHAAIKYAKEKNFERHPSLYILVVNDFGNDYEAMSFYEDYKLENKVYGFQNSLGMLERAAEKYCNCIRTDLYDYMDELDMIYGNGDYDRVHLWATHFYKKLYKESFTNTFESKVCDAKKYYDDMFTKFDNLLSQLRFTKSSNKKAVRAIIGDAIQRVIRGYLVNIIDAIKPKNLVLTGSIFHYIKLQEYLKVKLQTNILFYPLYDECAAIGWSEKIQSPFIFGDMYWGKRNNSFEGELPENAYYVTYDEFLEYYQSILYADEICCLVKGNMKFGRYNSYIIIKKTDKNETLINSINPQTFATIDKCSYTGLDLLVKDFDIYGRPNAYSVKDAINIFELMKNQCINPNKLKLLICN